MTRRRRLPPLLMARAFEAVGRLSSMRKAGDDLGLSHSVVSKHVRNLEAWLGVRLFNAGARGVQLTAEGRLLFERITTAFDLIAHTVDQLRRNVEHPALKVWCAPGLAARWLTPRLTHLQRIIPGLDIELRATVAQPDIVHGEADVEIRYSEQIHEINTPGKYVLLQEQRMFPVASPRWVAEHPGVKTLQVLARQPLIHEESRALWSRWFELSGMHNMLLNGPSLYSANLALDAAISGQGVALATHLNVADDIAAGRLVELLDTQIKLGAYYFIAAEQQWDNEHIAAFRAWLQGAVDARSTAWSSSNVQM